MSKAIKKLADALIEEAKAEFGTASMFRYQCPEYSTEIAYCFDDVDPPKDFQKYCTIHGKKIEKIETTEYSSQPWIEALEKYIRYGEF